MYLNCYPATHSWLSSPMLNFLEACASFESALEGNRMLFVEKMCQISCLITVDKFSLVRSEPRANFTEKSIDQIEAVIGAREIRAHLVIDKKI